MVIETKSNVEHTLGCSDLSGLGGVLDLSGHHTVVVHSKWGTSYLENVLGKENGTASVSHSYFPFFFDLHLASVVVDHPSPLDLERCTSTQKECHGSKGSYSIELIK